ncbi:hypothetical protein M0805_003131 [Coniferiporia weirii]|nr:hypothetical protein M0805_003131 [Coniferiporia weirii]
MLIVQPTSSCDVCLERYVWDATDPDSKPHVISCGHVFCQRCLQNLRIPRTCPLCRAAFHLARAVRVHIDLASDELAQAALTPEEQTARDFEERLGQASADDAAGSACRAVVDEALGWLEGAPADQHQTLRASLSLLDRYKELSENLQSAQDAAQRMREERDHYRRNLRRSERGREQEKILQQGHDEQWATKVSEIERECEKRVCATIIFRVSEASSSYALDLCWSGSGSWHGMIVEAETHRQNLEDELERCKRTLAAQLDAQAEAEAIVQAEAEAEAQARAQAQSISRPPSSEAQVQTQAQFPPNTQASSNHQAQTAGVVFPRASRSPEPYLSYFTEPEPFEFAHNPLPRPPEPVPLARLPAFARPRPGSRAYEAARVFARAGRLRGKDRDKDKDKEKRKEKEAGRDSGRESGRERDGIRERKREGALSGTERERDRQLRREKHRERERGTDTSATETQERSAEGVERRRSRHSLATSTVPVPASARVLSAAPTIVGQSSSGDRTIRPEGDMSANESVTVNGSAEGRARAVVGGWGLERSWRASLGSSTGSVSDLRAELGRAGSGETRVGSSHTRSLRVEKGKERERNSEREQKQDRVGDRTSDRERERPRDRNGDTERDEATDADDQGYVFVRFLPEEQQSHEKGKEQSRNVETERHTQAERRRSIAYPISTSDSTSSGRAAYADASRPSEKMRERRTTLSAIPQGTTLRPPIGEPSALGLTLVPSPSGSGYEHAYRAAYPPQSSIQIGSATGSASGRESVRQTPSYPNPAPSVNPQTGSSTYAYSYQPGSSYYPEQPPSRRGPSPTLARRATEPHLHVQAQAQAQGSVVSVAAAVPRPSALARASSTALHVPQPRRISTHIPEPEPEPETETDRTPAPPQSQSQTQAQPFQHPAAYQDTYGSSVQNPNIDQLYENPNMSLDSALARLTLASQQSRDQLRQQQHQHQAQTQNYGHGQLGHEQTLKHKTSTASSASTSTSISLMGTSGERRKQLLDALFTAPTSSTSASANASLVSLGQTTGADVVQVEPITANTGVVAGATASTRTAVATDRLRGVPSVDGRPSRGLSTRPSTVHPTQYTHAVRPVESHAQTAHAHARQTTYPPGTYTTYATSTGIPTHQAASSPYAQYPNPNYSSAGVGSAVYVPASVPGTYAQYPTSASTASTDANAYAAYYQAQQLQSQSQVVPTVGTGGSAAAGAASAGYMSAGGDYPHVGAYARAEMKARR